ncbi:hypothetical protein [Nocardiopsis sp. FIRDI 009]|uniref:hypothetical protein n=1 Tax=Nocardiopsis sp. FIRDI 009 TaxID=714197 RepID=UPI0013003F49|nr:hypothetical protein [Nocardiopsis sp. FIRDI 009]
MPKNTGPSTVPEVNRHLRGHDLIPPPEERALIPGDLGQDDLPLEEAIVHLHYFSPSADWWVTELWEDRHTPGRWWAFGFAWLRCDPEGGEWGRIDLTRLEALRLSRAGTPPHVVERDLAWKPTPARECLPGLV